MRGKEIAQTKRLSELLWQRKTKAKKNLRKTLLPNQTLKFQVLGYMSKENKSKGEPKKDSPPKPDPKISGSRTLGDIPSKDLITTDRRTLNE